ncbi:MAG TPA: thiamine phosphate synthase [Bryobacteraceae bacterium]|nr:thiamine phosphate synthase [Bryobacteraceae bacterium]
MIRYQITNGLFRQSPEAWFRTLRDDVDFIQIREKDMSAGELADLVERVVRSSRVRILVNDRIDVAIARGAAGVHLRSGSISPARVKQLAPLIVTVACHSEDEVKQTEGADYAILAPIFPPTSKPPERAPLGVETLRRAAHASPVPLLALGGITNFNASECIQAGAAGIAGIGLWSSV